MAATKSPSRTLLIAGIGVALACFVILNMVMQRLDPKYQEQLQQEAARKAAEAQAAKSGQPAGAQRDAPPPVTGSSTGGGNELAALGPDAVLGDKDSKKEITVGWQWTPDVQADPSKVYNAVQTLQKMMQGAKIRVVNIDDNPAVKPGISVGARNVAPLNADGSLDVNPTTLHQMMSGNSAPPVVPPPSSAAKP